MDVLVYTFNNGVFIKDTDEQTNKLLAYNSKGIEPLDTGGSNYRKKTTYFLYSNKETIDLTKITRKSTEMKTMDYELKEKGKMKSSITTEEFEKLTPYHQNFYKKGSEKEVITFEEQNVVDVLTFDLDFEPFNPFAYPESRKQLKKYMKQPHLMSDLVPSGIKHLLPVVVSGESLFKAISEHLKEQSTEYPKGTLRVFSSSITVSLYEKPYNGETKRKQVLKQNGRPYATPQYTTVRDIPKVIERREYEPSMFETIYADNELEMFSKLKKMISLVTSDLE